MASARHTVSGLSVGCPSAPLVPVRQCRVALDLARLSPPRPEGLNRGLSPQVERHHCSGRLLGSLPEVWGSVVLAVNVGSALISPICSTLLKVSPYWPGFRGCRLHPCRHFRPARWASGSAFLWNLAKSEVEPLSPCPLHRRTLPSPHRFQYAGGRPPLNGWVLL